MPYKDKKKQSSFQNDRVKKRRLDFFKEKKCVHCGGVKNLQIDHIDPFNKKSHKIFCWSIERMNEELKKCQVLCKDCHNKKTFEENKAWSLYRPRSKNGTFIKGAKRNRCPD